MKWVERFYPNHLYKNIYEIDFKQLKEDGIESLLIDLDNTIIPRNVKELTEEVEQWFKGLTEEGFKVCIVSNNMKGRVKKVLRKVEIPFVARAGKPRRKAFIQGIEALRTSKEKTAVIGDQLFTDVFGGNMLDLMTILVSPVGKSDLPHTKFLRIFENRLIRKFIKERKDKDKK